VVYPVIYFFSSEYCSPCKMVERMLKEINISLFGNKLIIEKVDIVSDLEMAKRYAVNKVPTIIVGSQRISQIIDREELVDVILQGFLSSVNLP